MLFLNSSHVKLRWKMMKLNIKVEIISLLLARIHRKIEYYFCISAEIWLLPDDLWHLSVNSTDHHTQASNSIISVFFNKLFHVDDKGACFAYNSIKRHSVSGRVSEYTWIIKQKQNRMTPQNVYLKNGAHFQQTFGINKWIKDLYSSCKYPISNIPQ